MRQILPVARRSTFSFSGSFGTFWNPELKLPFDVNLKLNLSVAQPQLSKFPPYSFVQPKFNPIAAPSPSQEETTPYTGESPDLFGAEKKHINLQPNRIELGPAYSLEASNPSFHETTWKTVRIRPTKQTTDDNNNGHHSSKHTVLLTL